MRFFIKFVHVLFWLLIFYIRSLLICLITRDPVRRRQRLNRNTAYICRHLMTAFHFSVYVRGEEHLPELDKGSCLVVSNHVSYTDILVLSSLRPFTFITSMEMGANRFLGGITRLGGSLYTDRRKHTTLPQEIENFARTIRLGFNVVLFPEGTSTNGETVKDFHKSLFQVAINAQSTIQPICIRYLSYNGRPITTQAERDLICWYGEMKFFPHFLKMLRYRFDVDVHFLEPIRWQEGSTRHRLCELTFSQIYHQFHHRS